MLVRRDIEMDIPAPLGVIETATKQADFTRTEDFQKGFDDGGGLPIIQAHGGTVTLRNIPEGGVEAVVNLPTGGA